ncbi:hypothetical protein Tco_1360458 [Tanacetum coccineum]
MSETIPPPPVPNLGNTRNRNRVENVFEPDNTNNNGTTNVINNVVEMWNDLIVSHEGPSKTRDTKIAALRLKFNAFKALEDVEEDTRSNSEFLVDLNVEFHDKALLAN